MTEKHEYRVRPVTRYIVTDFHSSSGVDASGTASGGVGSRVLAECPNEQAANDLVALLEAASQPPAAHAGGF